MANHEIYILSGVLVPWVENGDIFSEVFLHLLDQIILWNWQAKCHNEKGRVDLIGLNHHLWWW